MKRRDIIKKLEAAGLELRERGSHTKKCKDGMKVSATPRHTEIAERAVRAIAKQTGVDMK